jgi:hypothetical protein
MGTWLPETFRENKSTYMKKNCASSWLFTKTLLVSDIQGKVNIKANEWHQELRAVIM